MSDTLTFASSPLTIGPVCPDPGRSETLPGSCALTLVFFLSLSIYLDTAEAAVTEPDLGASFYRDELNQGAALVADLRHHRLRLLDSLSAVIVSITPTSQSHAMLVISNIP